MYSFSFSNYIVSSLALIVTLFDMSMYLECWIGSTADQVVFRRYPKMTPMKPISNTYLKGIPPLFFLDWRLMSSCVGLDRQLLVSKFTSSHKSRITGEKICISHQLLPEHVSLLDSRTFLLSQL